MYRGYIKLWRKSFDSNVWKNKNLWRFWTWCLLKATHKEIKAMVGYQEIKLTPGQFIFGRKKCSEETGLSEQNIRTAIRTLSAKKLTIKPTNKFSIITILNWHIYQSDENQNNQQITINQPTNNQQITTNKNDKNVNNKYSEDFLEFYNSYPLKVEKKNAFYRWKVLKRQKELPPTNILLDAIKKQKAWRENANGEFRPKWKHPAVWLNKGCWEDECEVKKKKIITGKAALEWED